MIRDSMPPNFNIEDVKAYLLLKVKWHKLHATYFVKIGDIHWNSSQYGISNYITIDYDIMFKGYDNKIFTYESFKKIYIEQTELKQFIRDTKLELILN